jgi:hypothetical protein
LSRLSPPSPLLSRRCHISAQVSPWESFCLQCSVIARWWPQLHGQPAVVGRPPADDLAAPLRPLLATLVAAPVSVSGRDASLRAASVHASCTERSAFRKPFLVDCRSDVEGRHGPGTVPTWTQPARPMRGGPSTRWPMARPGDEAPTSRAFVARIAAETHRLKTEHELVCPTMPHDDPLPEAKSA